MHPDELRALQAPLKEQYRADPARALVTLTAAGSLDDPRVSCRVETGPSGGDWRLGPRACSASLLLQSLVPCAGVTLRAVATSLTIPVRGRASARGG